MSDFDRYLEKQLQDPAFKKEWDALEPERALMRAIVKARAETGVTQQELAKRTGIPQANISRIEQGNANPTLKMLNRIAKGMGKKLYIEFR